MSCYYRNYNMLEMWLLLELLLETNCTPIYGTLISFNQSDSRIQQFSGILINNAANHNEGIKPTAP